MSSMDNYTEPSACWFHAIDVPTKPPIKKSNAASNNNNISDNNVTSPPKQKIPATWVAFSKRDSIALENAYKSSKQGVKVPCNEDYLFEVDIDKRELSPVYWAGPSYEVKRATWFIWEGGKFIPCDENLAAQIEEGYKKHRAWIQPPPESDLTNSSSPQSEIIQEKSWPLLGRYLSQYVVYTNPTTAWLLSDDMAGKLTKTFYSKLTNNLHLGGIRLLRGFNEVENFFQKKNSEDISASTTTDNKKDRDINQDVGESYDYEKEECEDEVRVIDHLILVIHGIGQKLSERMESINFVNDVNVFRKTIRKTFSNVNNPSEANYKSYSKSRFGKGVQVLPIQWRQEIKFGVASEDENIQRDLGIPEIEEGQTTLDEITLEGVPTLRNLISDVLMDVLLYMTPRYREMMINIVTREANRVYNLFIERNPKFLENNGKVSIYGHSLGSVLAFDILCHQPPIDPSTPSGIFDGKNFNYLHKDSVKLDFDVKNFFAVGSPIGLFLLLKGLKISSRTDSEKLKKLIDDGIKLAANMGLSLSDPDQIPSCFPAVKNLYNIFHNADPIAYRLEPLIARHYGAMLKPALIPYHKGGLKAVHMGIQEFSNDLANKATNIFSTVRTSLIGAISTSSSNINSGAHKKSSSIGSIPGNDNDGNNSNNGSGDDVISGANEGDALTNYPPTNFTKDAKNTTDDKEIEKNGAARIKNLNVSGRVDYVLQEGLLDVSYINAITVHLSYWSDLDAVNFILKEIDREEE
ncbi:9712_t:CDS:10 [Entrophospora sp. SA101]|nr:9712_t:CDS:10 [Entrophospora sp. SA101]